jgi:hypothetical protein
MRRATWPAWSARRSPAFEPVQHVELGQRDAVHARGHAGLAHQRRIEPAAAALAPRGGAEFMAPLAQALAVRIVKLGRERPLADPGRVGLHDAQHVVDGTGAEAHAGRRLPRDDIGGGHERIGAEIDIQKRALRPFEQDAAARAAPFVEHLPHRRGIGRIFGAISFRRRSAPRGPRGPAPARSAAHCDAPAPVHAQVSASPRRPGPPRG